ncbi:ABC transporter ATP-binding protein [Aestuariimicrobium sp. T2.26MG-19.2B]|uniref:ABC transporter ATP-binding protein n=1 Tax=Aestuariimicrobium sp. T2.26MG-19.2B TaxID=3040679 RepID=UPI002477C0ED|nr:ABC transporter ATP-binding protein [Aestuariimicrobium sp. T2.26MG-19.2B]CAI9402477.1 putative multidrug resistance ABC transporter ATP-binding/permease protein YheI [Aestuariimicrobium sp. T2.26MG-19.2B]
METFPPRIHAYGLPSVAANPTPRPLPTADERPDVRSPLRFLLWFLGRQWKILVLSALSSVLWFGSSAITPWMFGRAVDTGIGQRDLPAALGWAGWMLLAVSIGVFFGVFGHTIVVAGWVVSIYRTVGLISRRALSMGHVLPRRTPTGEVLSVAGGDADTFGATQEVLTRAIGAVSAFIFVTVLVLGESPKLGLVVLVAAPLLVGAAAPFLRPLQAARTKERTRSSELTGMATDIVAGLRILRGIGGEKTFGDNYVRQSQHVRRAGVEAGAWQSAVDALATLLGGLLLVLLTWLGVREVLAGTLSVGQLISFFGYAVYLVWPVYTMYEFVQKWVQGLVAAKKTVVVLGQSAPWKAGTDTVELPRDAVIKDEQSTFLAQPGQLTVVVSSLPDDSAALADRIGRYLTGSEDPVSHEIDENLKGRAAKRARAEKAAELEALAQADEERANLPWGVTYDGIDVSRFDLAEFRRRVLVSDTSAMIFAGTLQQLVDPLGRATREQAEEALRVASAEDVYDLVPGGWQGRIDERGRGLSGGQRQRLVLARALLADPEVLVMVEPTSAVDAHTEARIATRLAEARRGRTTIITTVSPLVLHVADEVVFMVDGVCVERGTHHDLMQHSPAYRSVVERGIDDDPAAIEHPLRDHALLPTPSGAVQDHS